jgi:hypothetical protein
LPYSPHGQDGRSTSIYDCFKGDCNGDSQGPLQPLATSGIEDKI